MTLVYFSPPPAPPEEADWYLACLMLAKGTILAAHQDEISKLEKDGRAAVHWIGWDTSIRLLAAECYGFSALVPMATGPVGLCFTHLAGVSVGQASVLALPNGLRRGRG